MLDAYRIHVAERAAQNIPPKPLKADQVAELVQLLKKLGADEVELMHRCEATYKLGIRFCDWHEKGHDSWHPYGVYRARIDGRDLFPFWLADSKRFGIPKPYEAYSLQWAASNAGKVTVSWIVPVFSPC